MGKLCAVGIEKNRSSSTLVTSCTQETRELSSTITYTGTIVPVLNKFYGKFR